MGGRRLLPPSVVKFPVQRPLGDILQSWAHRCPEKLRALHKFVLYIDAMNTAEIAKIIRGLAKTRP